MRGHWTRLVVVAVLNTAQIFGTDPELKLLRTGVAEVGQGTATFAVHAEANQLLQVRVEQERLALAIRWIAPAGETIAEAGNETLDEHDLVVSAISEAPGVYQVEVKLSPAPARRTEYRIELMPPRPAGFAERSLLPAEKIYYEGISILAKPGAANARAAVEKFRNAAELWKGSAREAGAMLQLSEAYFIAGDARTSLKWSTAALARFRQENDAVGIAEALNNQGVAHNALGAPRQAIECYEAALPFALTVPGKFSYGNLLNSLGRAYSNLSENDTAIRLLNQSLAVWREMKEIRWQGLTLNNLGLAYAANGELEQAKDVLGQALRFRRESGDQAGEAITIVNLGIVMQGLGDLQGAEAQFERALTLRQKGGSARDIASSQHQLGSNFLLRGHAKKAESYLVAAVETRRKVGDRIGEAASLLMLGKTYLRLGSAERAVESLSEALEITKQIGARVEQATTLSALARARGALGDTTAALGLAEASIQVHESVRGSITNPQSRARYLATVRDQYDGVTALLMEMGARDENFTARAMEASERGHARSMLDLLEEASVDIQEGVDPVVIARERELRATLAKLANGKEQEAAVSDTIRQLGDIQAEIRRQSPAIAALGHAALMPVEAIRRKLLDDDTALLEFSVGDQVSFAWVATKERLTSFRLPGRAELERMARAAYGALSVSNGDDAAVAALGRTILWPLVNALNKPRVAIVADGALLKIPFGALPMPGTMEPLARRMETVYLPSAAALASLRTIADNRAQAPRSAAVLADPVFSADDPRVQSSRPMAGHSVYERLPSSRLEATALAALLPNADIRLGFDAKRDFFAGDGLQQYRLLHLATHSVVNTRHPELSGVALSMVDRQGRAQQGFLPLSEISRLNLRADLVVLSACETGLGKEVRGEGLVGLSRAFLFAGSPRVVASLWQVPDQATAELMKRFYTAMYGKHMRAAEALRAAQLEIRSQRRWARPYYWAGFVLQGDWR